MTYIKKKIKFYWNKQPCNIKHSKKKLFTKEYFEEVKKKRYFIEPHIRNFADFKKYKNKNVLEIGCGIGTDAIEFIKYGAKYIGIDYSEKSIEIAKVRVQIYNLQKYKPSFFYGDAENLSFLQKLKIKFDLIYSFGVLHHTPNMKRCFNEIYKLANYNTDIKIMLYAKNSYKNFLVNKTSIRYEAQKGCPVVHKVSEKDVNNLIKNKFNIIERKQDFIFPYKINKYKKNIYDKLNYFKIMPKKIFDILAKNIGEHLLLYLKKS
jgi:ubiquinone/menaquinone biosynthesis C-methylase UbiE